MTSVKLPVCLLLFFLALSPVLSQDLINLIPKDASTIGVVDLNKIKTKSRFDELAKLPIFQSFSEMIAKSYFKDSVKENAADYIRSGKYGISTNSRAYFYYANADRVMYGVMLISLSNEAAFTRFVKKLIEENDTNKIVVKGNFKYAQKKELRMIWNDKSVAFWGGFVAPASKDSIRKSLDKKYNGYNYLSGDKHLFSRNDEVLPDTLSGVFAQADNDSITDSYHGDEITGPDTLTANNNDDHPYVDVYSMSDSICNTMVNEWGIANQEKLLSDGGLNSLANNKEVTGFLKSEPDAAFVIEYGSFINMFLNTIINNSYFSGRNMLPFTSMLDLYKGLTMYAKVKFNAGEVELTIDTKFSDKLKEIYKEVKKKNISTNFLKYMDKNLMGYLALGLDIQGISKGVGNYMRNTFAAMPEYGTLAASIMDVIDIIVDEQSLYDVFTGDVVFAVNGIKPVKVIHTSYKYDDEYNKTEVSDTTTQMRPELTCMLGVGNPDDVNKILKLFMNLRLLRLDSNCYVVEKKGTDVPLLYVKLQDNILFLGNSKSYIKNPVVYTKDKQLGKEHLKRFKQYTYAGFFDLANITSHFYEVGFYKFKSKFTNLPSLFSSLTMYGGSKDGQYSSSSYILKFKDNDNNAMVDIIWFLNSVYLQSQKKI